MTTWVSKVTLTFKWDYFLRGHEGSRIKIQQFSEVAKSQTSGCGENEVE